MTNLRNSILAISAVFVGAGAWAIGCSSGNNAAGPGDGGGDATTDGTTPDSPIDDAMQQNGGDGGQDSASDGSLDANALRDASLDAPQVSDGGMYLFPTQVAEAFCERLASCCLPGDASTFDTSLCVQRRLPYGQGYSSLGTESTGLFGPALVDGGNVAFNATSAQACLGDIAAIDCNANVITGAQSVALYRDCYGALQGTLPVGSTCHGPIECSPGEFCDIASVGADGGVTLACKALQDSGAPCGEFATAYHDPYSLGPVLGETACSYRGSGGTNQFCSFSSLASSTFGAILDAGSWTCTPSGSAGSRCVSDLECLTKLCDPGANSALYQCVSSETFVYPKTCSAFAKKDAGLADAGSD